MPVTNSKNILVRILKEEGIEEIYLKAPRNPIPGMSNIAINSGVDAVRISSKDALTKLQNEVLPCSLCKELSSKRHSVVFGSGSPQAQLMFVGEAPGADEDEQGLPFVGRAGQLLTKIIESIQLTREDVYIANVLKCRPPGNRAPEPDEITNCSPFLRKQIEIIRPRILCALGTFAGQTLLQTSTPISQLRGRFYDWSGIRLICTYHPAYLLRNPSEKRAVWEDMKLIRKELDRPL